MSSHLACHMLTSAHHSHCSLVFSSVRCIVFRQVVCVTPVRHIVILQYPGSTSIAIGSIPTVHCSQFAWTSLEWRLLPSDIHLEVCESYARQSSFGSWTQLFFSLSQGRLLVVTSQAAASTQVPITLGSPSPHPAHLSHLNILINPSTEVARAWEQPRI
jgi:hypothetical protein